MNNCFKLGSDIHHLNMAYLGILQDHTSTVSHLDFGYFDRVNSVDRVNHVSQHSDSKMQHGLYLSETCLGPILYSHFSRFVLGSPEK